MARFANYESVARNDLFYLRFNGATGLGQSVLPENSGWLCALSSDELSAVWAPEPPATAVLWRAQAGLSGAGTIEVVGVESGLRLALGPGIDGRNVRIVLRAAGPPWTFSQFRGYSNNQVPGYGAEVNWFQLALSGVSLFLRSDKSVLGSALAVQPAALSLLYLQGARDNLQQENQVSFNLRAVPQGTWLTWDASGSPRRLILSSERAAQFQAKSLLEVTDVFQFTIGLVASPWLVGTDRRGNPGVGLEGNRLVLGQGSEESGLVATTTFVVPAADFRFNVPVPLRCVVGTSFFSVTEDLELRRDLTDKTLPSQLFEFVLDAPRRLRLGFSDILGGHVAVTQPLGIRAANQAPDSLLPLVGQRDQPGCTTWAIDTRWYPEVVAATDVPVALSDCYMRWTSGNANDPGGNLFYIGSGSPGEPQNQKTLLRSYPMAFEAQCFVDTTTQTVPPLCGAVQLHLFSSNLARLPAPRFLDLAMECVPYARDPLVYPDREGWVSIFWRDVRNLPEDPCHTYSVQLTSTMTRAYPNVIVSAVVVPENLMLRLIVESGPVPSPELTLFPGTYSLNSLLLLAPNWPQVARTIRTFCMTVNPRSMFIAKMCSGFAGPQSAVYRPQSDECNAFMRDKCQSDQLFNSAVCGCFQDQNWFKSLWLPDDVITKMVNAPQCFGPVCALGAAYRIPDWTVPCGDICQQVIAGNGTAWQLSGEFQLTCNGSIYNVGQQNAPPPGALTPQTLTWIVVFAVLAALTVVFVLALLLVKLLRKKPIQG